MFRMISLKELSVLYETNLYKINTRNKYDKNVILVRRYY